MMETTDLWNGSHFAVVSKKYKRVAKSLIVVLSMIMIDELGDGPGAGL